MSAVTLQLPAERVTTAEGSAPASSVLIVDDDPAICLAYFEVLTARGYDVALAGSRLDALAQIDRLDGMIDIIIMDISLPDADGATLAREIIELVPGTKSKITFQPMPPDDPRVRQPDITRAKSILGWTPTVPRNGSIVRVAYGSSELPTGRSPRNDATLYERPIEWLEKSPLIGYERPAVMPVARSLYTRSRSFTR